MNPRELPVDARVSPPLGPLYLILALVYFADSLGHTLPKFNSFCDIDIVLGEDLPKINKGLFEPKDFLLEMPFKAVQGEEMVDIEVSAATLVHMG